MTSIVRAILDTLGGLDDDVRDLVVTIATGALAGFLAVGFTLGGLWALRGRPALSAPRCRRCRSHLRGAGRDVPVACPECGLALAHPESVRWLAFRRQPLTLAITAPVVFVGGVTLAILASIEIERSVLRAVSWRVATVRFMAAQATVDDASEPSGASATSAEDQEASIEALVAIVRRGGGEGTDAMLRLVESKGLRWNDAQHFADTESAALRSLVEDLSDGTAPATAFGPTALTARGPRLRGDEIASLGLAIARALVVSGQADVAWGDRVIAPWTPRIACVVPRQVRPGSLVSVGFFEDSGHIWSPARVLDVRIDSASVLGPVTRPKMWSVREAFTAPTTAGDFAIEVDWETSIPGIGDGGETSALAKERHATRAALRVADEPERVELISDLELNLADDARFNLRLIVEPIGERDMVTIVVQAPDSVAFNGRWDISIDGEWTPLADQVTSLFVFNRQLVRHPVDGWPAQVSVRYVPDASPERLVLGADRTSAELGNRTNAAELRRCISGAWAMPQEFVATRTADAAHDGSPRAIGYRVGREAKSAARR